MDLDGDGKSDLLSGSYPGEIYFFKGQGAGKFARAEPLKGSDGKPLKLGLASVVFAFDWNHDGNLDLLVGDIEGRVHLVLNEGTNRSPRFGPGTLLQADHKTIQVALGDSGPTVADWDGDGKPDLIVGTGAGGVVWYRNTGTAAAPELAAAQTLVEPPPLPAEGAAPPPPQPGDAPRHGVRAKVHAVDWNHDGKLDLLVGDFASEDPPVPVVNEAEQAERKAKNDAWLKEYAAAQKTPPNETTDARQQRMKRIAALVTRKREMTAAEAAAAQPPQPKYHGHVWLYLRQPGVARAQ